MEKTQDHCDRMFEEFQRMRKHLQTVSGRISDLKTPNASTVIFIQKYSKMRMI